MGDAVMTVTIKDIAEAAQVSVATVSRVLGNKEGFYSEKTAKKVRKVATKLGYRKNTSAVELVTRKSQVLGVIVAATKTNFSNQIIEGIQDEAFKKGLSVIILYANENDSESQARALQTVIERSVMGILVLAIQLMDDNLALLKDSRIPYRFLSTSFYGNKLPFTASDDFQIGYQATDFLIRKGHQKIGIVAIDTSLFIGQQRVAGYRQAMQDAQLSVRDCWIRVGKFTYQDGVAAMAAFGPQPDVTAIIGGSDMAAIGVLNQAQSLGLEIPDQLAVMSIDGTELVKIVRPKITSVTQSFYEMGKMGTRLLLETEVKPQSEYVPFKIEERQSTR